MNEAQIKHGEDSLKIERGPGIQLKLYESMHSILGQSQKTEDKGATIELYKNEDDRLTIYFNYKGKSSTYERSLNIGVEEAIEVRDYLNKYINSFDQ